MGNEHFAFIPYPPIGKHGVTGDRRTAALVAADGTIDWMCSPDYDDAPIFGALLDAGRGGYWRLGPKIPALGEQTYVDHTSTVLTHWNTDTGQAEVWDTMLWPEADRPDSRQSSRVLLRRLTCMYGKMECRMELQPRYDFSYAPRIREAKGGALFEFDDARSFGLWTSFPLEVGEHQVTAEFTLSGGDEVWAIFGLQEDPHDWNTERAKSCLHDANTFWHDWLTQLRYRGMRSKRVEHSALIIKLLGYAPDGSLVAAPTTSLPEAIGGSRNYDYRYAWVRDASLSVTGLVLLGDSASATRYLDWLASLPSETQMPVQVAYSIRGGTQLAQQECSDLFGYRRSRPVLKGNRAYKQLQLGPLGFLADCLALYLEQGGEWYDQHWKLLERVAHFITQHWHEPDSSIWELPSEHQFVSSKVMCWVVLDRAMKIAQKTGHEEQYAAWREVRDTIHAEVMERGWSERRQSFVQRYDREALDAAALLIPVMDFLPADHPRVRKTVDRIRESLTIDGLVYRFNPLETPVSDPAPLGEFEASFLPCSFWLAGTYAKAGQTFQAQQILARVESLTQGVGLFSEEADARNDQLMGNYPLLFSQVEYIRAVCALDNAVFQ